MCQLISKFNHLLILILIALFIYIFTYPVLNGCISLVPNIYELSGNQKSSHFMLISNVQQEGVTKVLHQGTYGQVQNIFNDSYYTFVYAVMKFWTKVAQYGIFSTIIQCIKFFFIGIITIFGTQIASLDTKDSSQSPRVHTFFLGDLFSSPNLYDDQFRNQLKRWEKVFPYDSKVDKINTTGNTDLGYGYSITGHRLKRFGAEFGEQNLLVELDQLSIVFPISVALDGSSFIVTNETWTFLELVSEYMRFNPSKHLILVTHIPLNPNQESIEETYHSIEESYLEPNEEIQHSKQFLQTKNQKTNINTKILSGNCEPYRFQRAHDGMVRMQTHLTPYTTQKLLNLLKPSLILSGHDYYGCKMEHSWEIEGKIFRTTEYIQQSIQGEYGGHVGVLKVTSEVLNTNKLKRHLYLQDLKQIVQNLSSNNLDSNNFDSSGTANQKTSFNYTYKSCGFLRTNFVVGIISLLLLILALETIIQIIYLIAILFKKLIMNSKKVKQD